MNDGSFNHKASNNDQPTISIIIATYNAEKEIKECLESIATQSFKNIEVVVVDGGSTDNTCTIVKNFRGTKLSWISEPDKGIYDALNKGTKMAKGKWFHFLGADDRLLPGFSKLAVKLKEEDTVYYGDSEEYYDPANKPDFIILTGRFSKYRLAKYCMNHQAILYPANVFKKYYYQLQYKVFADYALNIQVWGDGEFNKVYHPVFIVRYNMNGFSSLHKDELFKKDKPTLIKKNMGWPIYLRFLYKQYKKKLLGEKE